MKATTTISRSQSGPAAPAFAARLQPARSGIAMDVWTTEPGLKFYDGGGLLVRAAQCRARCRQVTEYRFQVG